MSIDVGKEILIFAFRYALGRESYSSVSVMNNIQDNIDNLSDNDITLYIREIKEFNNYADRIEKDSWFEFAHSLEKELDGRG
jgi:hypothetical protein